MPTQRLETVIRWSLSVVTLLCVLLCYGCYKGQWVRDCEEEADCDAGHCYSGYCISEASAEKYGFTEDDIIWEKDVETDDETVPPALNGVDVLFVIDNTFTMIEEQEEMFGAVPDFVEQLAQKLLDGFDNGFDGVRVRFGVTTTDLGVSFGGEPFDVTEGFDLAPACGERAYGDDGKMRSTYLQTYEGLGACVAPESVLRDDFYFEMRDASDVAVLKDVMGCMMPVGTEGCAFEQHFSATVRAISRNDQRRFFRGDALTVIIMVTDEDDCSIADEQWIAVAEESANPALLCGGDNASLLYDVSALKEQLEGARFEASGVEGKNEILFAAIAGVPEGGDCEGSGDEIDGCLDVKLPGGGTMADPRMVNGEGTGRTSNYALACTRYSDEGEALTQAYPAIRIVKMAQKFDEMGYLYSICNTDFSDAMADIARKIETRLRADMSVE